MRGFLWAALAISAAHLTCAYPSPAQESAPSSLRIPRVSRPPRIEDFVDGNPRLPAAHVTGFRQRSPADGAPATEDTEAYLSYDSKNVYVVFVCKDDPDQIRAHMAKREDIGNDDQVLVYFDTFHDRQHAYIFVANPLGIQQDGISTEGQDPDYNFDTVWYTDARLTGDGFIVRMAIPFKSMRFKSGDIQTWGIALGRSIQRKQEVAYWPYITRRVEGFVKQMAPMEGLERISTGRNVQFIPYTTLTPNQTLNPYRPGLVTKLDARAGLDSKVVIRDAFTLDVTLNPDFSQVESDDPQVTVNQRFEVFFPEKRPFFLDNSNYFVTPINLFFSRRIGDPEYGARLTGKAGRWALGLLAMDDRGPGEGTLDDPSLQGQRAHIGVFRAQRDIFKDSRIGVLISDRDFASSWNRVFSIDTRLKLSRNWSFTGQMAHSYDRDLQGNKVQGPAYVADLLHAGEHFTYDAGYSDRGPGFRAPLGFITRVDVREFRQSIAYLWRPEGRRILSYGPSFSSSFNWDRTGRLQDWYTYADFNMELTHASGLSFSRYDAYEYFHLGGFRHHKSDASFYTAPYKWLSLYGTYSTGTGVNYTPAQDVSPFVGRADEISFGITYRPNTRMRLSETYFFDRLGTLKGYLAPGSPPAAVFDNQIMRTKLNYQFTRALSLRAILDYYALLPNISLFDDIPSKKITGDVLLTYLLNPGTALYVGYNTNYRNLLIHPGEDPFAYHHQGPPSTLAGRQFFVKLSYLFRF